jgi:hypothetical protein
MERILNFLGEFRIGVVADRKDLVAKSGLRQLLMERVERSHKQSCHF